MITICLMIGFRLCMRMNCQSGSRRNRISHQTPLEPCSKLTSQAGSIHEPTAGNGSMIIADWWQRCHNKIPWEHFPSQNMVTCWELSARSIPILLLNLSIRGLWGRLSWRRFGKSIKMKYILLNRKDDTLGFSDIIKDPEHKLIIKSNIQ